jgi:putative redox protein
MTGEHDHQVHGLLPAGGADYAVSLRARDHSFTADEPPREGGADAGARPFELALAGLVACTAITVRMYAKRKQWPLGDVEVGVSMLKKGEGFAISRTVRLGGELTEEQRARIAEICEKTPVTLLMKQGASLRTTVSTG